MKRLLTLLSLFVSCLTFAQTETLYTEWVENYFANSTVSDVSSATDVVVDTAGFVYVVGYFQGTVDFDPTPAVQSLTAFSNGGVGVQRNNFVSKHNPDGTLVWVRNLGEGCQTYADPSIDEDKNELFIVTSNVSTTDLGDFDPSAGTQLVPPGLVCVKMDINGNLINGYAVLDGGLGAEVIGRDIQVADNGQVIVVGSHNGSQDFDSGGGSNVLATTGICCYQSFCLSMDNNMVYQWAVQWGSMNMVGTDDDDEANSIDFDRFGNIVIAGGFREVADFDPNPGFTVQETGNANFTAASRNPYVLKLNNLGGYVWHKVFLGYDQFDNGTFYDLELDGNDNIYLLGRYAETLDFDPNAGVQDQTSLNNGNDNYVLKLDENGNYIWWESWSAGTGTIEEASKLKLTNNRLYIYGEYAGSLPFYGNTENSVGGTTDSYVLKLDTDANYITHGVFGSTGQLQHHSVYTDTSGTIIYAVGQVYSGVEDFQTGTLSHPVDVQTGADGYVHKILICAADTITETVVACDSTLWEGSYYTTSGTFFQNYVDINGCDSVRRLDLTINLSPVISSPITASNNNPCEGDLLTLNGPTIPGVDYSWTGPNGFTSTLEDPSIANVTSVNSGTYTLVLTDPITGCVSSPNGNESVVVNVNPAPIISVPVTASNNTPCENDVLSFDAPTIAGVDYLWTGPNGFTSTLEDPSIVGVTPAASGTYTLVVTDQVTGCSSLANGNESVVVNVNPAPVIGFVSVSDTTPCTQWDTVQFFTTTDATWTYDWSGPNGYTSTDNNPIIYNVFQQDTAYYSVTVTDLNGCTSSDSVEVFPLFHPSNVGDGSMDNFFDTGFLKHCENDSATLIINGMGLWWNYSTTNPTYDTTNLVFAWTGPGGLTSDQPNVVFDPFEDYHQGLWELVITDTVTGCNAYTDRLVVIDQAPVVGPEPLTDFGTLCEGDDLVLNAPSDAIGTQDLYFFWSGPNGFNVVQDTVTISPVSSVNAGTYNLMVVDSITYCEEYLDVTIAINDAPVIPTPVTVSNNTPCEGDNIAFDAPTIPGVDYAWSGPNGFTSTLEDPTLNNVTPINSGDYTLVVTDQVTGCSSLPSVNDTANVLVNPAPVIAVPVTASSNTPCENDLLTFDAPTIAGVDYLWTGPNGFTSTLEDPSITNVTTLASGTYTLVVTDQVTGCSSLANGNESVVVNVNPAPVIPVPVTASNNTPCENDLLSFDAPTIAGVDYSWTGPNGFTSTLEDPSISNVTTAASGTYTLVITDQVTGCSSLPNGNESVTVTVNPNPVISTPVSASNNAPCEGDDVTLDAMTNAGWDYAWTGPNGFTSTLEDPTISNVTGVNSGTYTLVVTDQATGCSSVVDANAETTITVNPLPIITTPVAVSSSNPCEGEDITLDGMTNAGWDYAWTGPNGFTSTLEDPIITNVGLTESGTYTLVVTDQVTGCSSVIDANAQITVTVNPNPVISTPVSASNNAPCEGDDVTLDAMTNAGWDYAWTGPNGFTSTLEDPIITNVTGVNSGTYTLVVTDLATGCSSVVDANAQTTITVNPAPVIPTPVTASSNTPCEGDLLSFDAPTIAGVDYSWTGPNGFTSILEDPSITNVTTLASGTYTLIVTDQVTGCSSLANGNESVVVNVNPAPVIPVPVTASNNTPCEGDNVDFDAPTIVGVDYAWTGPNGFTSTLEDPTITNVSTLDNGTYVLVVTDQVTGCSSLPSVNDSVTILITLTPTTNIVDTVVTCNTGVAVLDAGVHDSYLWSTAETTQTINVSNSGWFYVTVYENGCASAMDSVYADVSQNSISVSDNGPLCLGDDFVFGVTGGGTYEWVGPLGFYSTDSTNIIYGVSLDQIGDYNVTVTYDNGCVLDGGIALALDESGDCFKIPEIITPNDDNLNDVFIIDFLVNYPDNSLVILNRWGTKVYEASPYNNDFDGTSNQSMVVGSGELPNGTYVYILTLGSDTEPIQGLLEIQK